MQNIFTYTASEPYPQYLSINRQKNGRLTITVRAPSQMEYYNYKEALIPVCGEVAKMTLPDSEIIALVNALFNAIKT